MESHTPCLDAVMHKGVEMEKRVNWVKWLSAVIWPAFVVFGPAQWAMAYVPQEQSGMGNWPQFILALVTGLAVLIPALLFWTDGHLKEDWRRWRTLKTHKNLLAMLGAVFMFVVLTPIAQAISGWLTKQYDWTFLPGDSLSFMGVLLPTALISVTSLMSPFMEEIIYHSALIKPFENRKVAYIVVSIFSNLLFAFVHLHNVHGHMWSLLLYVVMGVFFQFIYERAGRNIWQNIMTHLYYNGFIALVGVISAIAVAFAG